MPYFSYHARNKKLIKEGFLENFYYEERDSKRYLILVFKDGRKFQVKEERWMEYHKLIDGYFEREE